MNEKCFGGAIGDRPTGAASAPTQPHPFGLQQHIERALGNGPPADLFDLLDDRASASARLAALEGWGPKSANSALDALQRTADRALPVADLLYALGPHRVGRATARRVASSDAEAHAHAQVWYAYARSAGAPATGT